MSDSRSPRNFDLVIIGGGSAASAATAEALRLGKSVAKIQHGPIGGTCLNVGCMPSKTLLAAAADRARSLRNSFDGVTTSAEDVRFGRLVADKERFLDSMRVHHVENARSGGFTHVDGRASFVPGAAGEPVRVRVESDGHAEVVEAGAVIVATGAAPFIPPIPGLSEVPYLTSATAMALDSLPASLLVIGGNAIGLEQAQLFASLGSRVTIVEVAPRIAPMEDPAISEALHQALVRQGVQIYTGAELSSVAQSETDVEAQMTVNGEAVHLQAEKVLVATGRRPNTAGLNAEALGIDIGPRGEIVTDPTLRTSHPRVWAAGDVVGGAQFVYVATLQGEIAAANALGGESRTMNEAAIPRVTFTSPPLASVGMTAAQAREEGIEADVRELNIADVARAMVSREEDGVLQLVSDRRTGRILGAHMVGAEAGEVISTVGYLLPLGADVEHLATSWVPFLTMSESLQIVARSAPITA